MQRKYDAPAVRLIDLRQELSFCLSGSLEDTYDDPVEE